MQSLSVRLLLSLFVLLLTPAVFAHDVTISGTQNFSALDGSSADHDGAVNGVFTVNDGNLIVNGVVNCNDDTTTSACPMAFVVSGNMTINSGGALYAENRSGSGTGAAITLTVGGNLALNGTAIVSTSSKSSSGSNGGTITANVSGSVALGAGTTIDSGAANATGGSITIAAGNVVSVNGNVLSGPSRTILSTRLTDLALDGGTGNTVGGSITISSSTFVEPALSIGATANIISQGSDGGAGPVKLDACGIQIRGLVAALSTKDSAAKVAIRSGKDVLIDGRDLGGSGTRMGRVRADAPSGTAVNKGVDVFAGETIDLLGPSGSLYVITSHPGQHDSKSYGGLIRILSLGEGINASGNVVDSGRTASGDTGGTVQVSAKNDVNLNTAVLRAIGDSSTGNPNRGGGAISVRSYSGNVIWTNGTGDVRPVGSSSGLAPADQGSIVLTACGTINTTGSTFPSNGTPTSPLPDTHTGSCSPAAPSLPAGVPPLVTCNTPPVANDTAATTNEDTTVTITMTGSDADGDSLTFSIVSGPSHGALGPVVFVNATTSTVNYTPNLNYNGTDSFVFRANDGNGGTDDATATITINPVNDPPTFQIGPTVTRLEDSGAQTITPWATAISPGPADESAQTVTFTTTNNNNALFSVQPFVASNGTLTFTPAPNAYGSATVTVVAQDNGGTANGGNDTSAPQTSTITITAVNDEPSFVKGADQTVNEDAGPQTVSPWATAISAGPNESGQTLTFVTSNNNNALFSAQPSVSSSGTLTYTPAADAFGTATVTVYLTDNGGTANGGDDTSPSQTFTITVNSVNDAPSFTSGGNVTVNEDSGAYSAAWATGISAGPANESSQTVSFNTSNDNNTLFSAQPSISSSGVLTFTLASNANGTATVTVTAQDNGGTANGGVDTSAPQTFTITVNSVNDEPTFTPGGNQTVNEDAGPQSVVWATAISAGPANESSQTITFVVSNDNNALFSSQPAIASNGTLTYTPAANASGTATVTVYAQDNGGIANGGDDTSATYTFTITVNAVNDAPSFTGGGDVTVLEDSGAYSASWATAISAGAPDESGQTLTFNIVSNSNPSLFASGPSISAGGVLSFTPAANAFGSATLVINLSDNGGTANGGVDTSSNYTFTINVTAVNDAPSFTPGGDVTVNEDSGLYSATWATAISPGPNESGQTVAFTVTNNNNALFVVQPSISPSGTLTFTPAPNAFGSATVTVFLSDNGGTANGGVNTSASVQFTINVNAVNDAPTAGNDSWETFGNTELRVDLAAGLTPNVSDTTPSGGGVRDNDSDPEGDPFVITGIVGCSDVTAPFDCTLGDGSKVSMLANGSFSYTPGPGNTTGSFQYTLTDIPAFGAPASSIGTVTITIHEMIWYVNGSAAPGGNGTSIAPLNSFAGINGPGGAGDSDGPNDYIFVHTSLVNSSIALELGQKLWGEGYGLSINQNLNGNGAPTVLVPAGVKPTVTFGTDVITANRTGIDIAGLSLSSTSGNAIDVTTTALAPAAAVSIHDNVVTGAGQEGINVSAGTTAGTTVLVNNTSITSSGNGFDVDGSAAAVVSYNNGTITSTGGNGIRFDGAGSGGNLTVTGLNNVTIDGTTAGVGISINSATFDAIAGGSFDTVSGGTVTVGSNVNPVGGSGVMMANVSGDYAIGTLNVFGGTTGVTVSGSGLFTGSAGMRITSGGGTINAPAGVGLSVANATIGSSGLVLTRITSTGTANGIVLNNTGTSGGLTVTGTGTAGSGGSITNATADSILLSSTKNVSLSYMNVTNSGQSHVDATNVDGLSLINSNFDNSADHGILGSTVRNLVIQGGLYDRGGAAAVVANKHGVFITNLLGNSSVTGATFRRSNTIQFRVANTTATTPAPGAPDVLTVSNTTWDQHTGPFAGDHLSVDASTGGNFRLVTNSSGGINTFTTGGVAVQATASGSGRMDLSATGLLVNGASTAAIVAAGTSTSTLTFSIFGNKTANGTGFSNTGSLAVSILSTGSASVSGTFDNNSILNTPGSNALQVIQEGNGQVTAAITNNSITGDILNDGIRAQARLGTGTLALTITGNTVSSTNPGALDAISIESGASGAGHANTICLNMANNNASTASGQEGYRLRQRAGTTFNLQNFAGSGTSATDISNWINVTKANVGTTDIVIGTSFGAAPSACATP